MPCANSHVSCAISPPLCQEIEFVRASIKRAVNIPNLVTRATASTEGTAYRFPDEWPPSALSSSLSSLPCSSKPQLLLQSEVVHMSLYLDAVSDLDILSVKPWLTSLTDQVVVSDTLGLNNVYPIPTSNVWWSTAVRPALPFIHFAQLLTFPLLHSLLPMPSREAACLP